MFIFHEKKGVSVEGIFDDYILTVMGKYAAFEPAELNSRKNCSDFKW